PPTPSADWIMPAITRAERTMARPAMALTIADLPRSIWWGLPAALMYMKAPHMRKKAATVTATPRPMLSRFVKRLLMADKGLTSLMFWMGRHRVRPVGLGGLEGGGIRAGWASAVKLRHPP